MAAVEHGLRLTTIQPIVPSLDDIYRARRVTGCGMTERMSPARRASAPAPVEAKASTRAGPRGTRG